MKKQSLFTFVFVIIVVGLLIGAVYICEKESSDILKQMGWMDSDGEITGKKYGKKYSPWRCAENVSQTFTGYNDSLQLIAPVYVDANGFITGDTVDLPREKPAGEIRIFLTGGSTAFGSLQTRTLLPDSSYPAGVYCFESSIAGRMQQKLQAKHPDKKIRVINAAVVEYCFNQNYAHYYEKLHDFSPDVIVNMDGHNDSWHDLRLIDPYTLVNDRSEKYLNLEFLKKINQSFGSTATLLAANRFNKPADNNMDFAEIVKEHYGTDVAEKLMKESSMPPEKDYPSDSFLTLLPFLEKSTEKQFWLIKSYENQLAQDGVFSVYCLQPTLTRKGKQKDLHPTEQKLLAQLHEDAPYNRLLFDSLLIDLLRWPENVKPVLAAMGDAKCFMPQYYYKHFINDYISPNIDSIVTKAGGRYVDMNTRLDTMGAQTFFYVDHCHLTVKGNEYVANILAEEVEGFLKGK